MRTAAGAPATPMAIAWYRPSDGSSDSSGAGERLVYGGASTPAYSSSTAVAASPMIVPASTHTPSSSASHDGVRYC
jgi:hypothetical protein